MSDPRLDRQVRRRLAVLGHVEEATGKVAMTCRYYGISRGHLVLRFGSHCQALTARCRDSGRGGVATLGRPIRSLVAEDGAPPAPAHGGDRRRPVIVVASRVVRAMTAGSRRHHGRTHLAAHTCWAEEPLATKALAPAWPAIVAIPSLSAAEDITTWSSGRRLRIWPRNPRTRRATRLQCQRDHVVPVNNVPPPQTSGPPDPDQTESTIGADPRCACRAVLPRPAAHMMPDFGWRPNSDTAATIAAS
jgi:hypothetical protein